jgi:hypothetical protein
MLKASAGENGLWCFTGQVAGRDPARGGYGPAAGVGRGDS